MLPLEEDYDGDGSAPPPAKRFLEEQPPAPPRKRLKKAKKAKKPVVVPLTPSERILLNATLQIRLLTKPEEVTAEILAQQTKRPNLSSVHVAPAVVELILHAVHFAANDIVARARALQPRKMRGIMESFLLEAVECDEELHSTINAIRRIQLGRMKLTPEQILENSVRELEVESFLAYLDLVFPPLGKTKEQGLALLLADPEAFCAFWPCYQKDIQTVDDQPIAPEPEASLFDALCRFSVAEESAAEYDSSSPFDPKYHAKSRLLKFFDDLTYNIMYLQGTAAYEGFHKQRANVYSHHGGKKQLIQWLDIPNIKSKVNLQDLLSHLVYEMIFRVTYAAQICALRRTGVYTDFEGQDFFAWEIQPLEGCAPDLTVDDVESALHMGVLLDDKF